MRFAFILGVMIISLWIGTANLYMVYKNQDPYRLPMAEATHSAIPTDKIWVQIDGGYLNFLETVFWRAGDDVVQIHVPLVDDPQGSTPLRFFVEIVDEPSIRLVQQLIEIENKPMHLDQFVKEHLEELIVEKSINGTLLRASSLTTDELANFKNLYPNLHDDFFIIKENSKPSYFIGAIFLVVALLSSILLLVLTKKQQTEAVKETKTVPPEQTLDQSA